MQISFFEKYIYIYIYNCRYKYVYICIYIYIYIYINRLYTLTHHITHECRRSNAVVDKTWRKSVFVYIYTQTHIYI